MSSSSTPPACPNDRLSFRVRPCSGRETTSYPCPLTTEREGYFLHPLDTTTPTTGDILTFDGTSWVPTAPGSSSSPLTTKGDIHGFDTVDAGPLKEGWRIQRDTPGYGPRRNAAELREDLVMALRGEEVEHPPQHRLECIERHRVVGGVERLLVPLFAEVDRFLEGAVPQT